MAHILDCLSGSRRIKAELTAGTGFGTLDFHFGFKSIKVYTQALFGGYFGSHLHRKAVSIVQFKGILPGNPPSFGLADYLFQKLQTGSQRFRKTGFLTGYHLQYIGLPFFKFRINAAHTVNNRPGHIHQEGSFQSQPAPEKDCPPKQTAKHIAPPRLVRNNPVSNQKGNAPAVFGYYPQGSVSCGITPVFPARKQAGFFHNWGKYIGFVYVFLGLHQYSQAFQPHAGINAGGRQVLTLAALVLIKLDKYQIPYFTETAALAGGVAIRLAAARFLPEIIVDFTARAAGT